QRPVSADAPRLYVRLHAAGVAADHRDGLRDRICLAAPNDPLRRRARRNRYSGTDGVVRVCRAMRETRVRGSKGPSMTERGSLEPLDPRPLGPYLGSSVVRLRIDSSACLSRDFTVRSGMLSASAICCRLKSSTNRSTTTSR